MRLACDVFQCSLSARARERTPLVESCRCTFFSPVPSSVQSFPIRPFFEWVVVGNLFLESEAVASLMYDSPHKLRQRYAEFVGPLFNERFILRFEIEIYSDRHFSLRPRSDGAWTAEIPIHAPQKGPCDTGRSLGLASALPYVYRAVPPSRRRSVRTFR